MKVKTDLINKRFGNLVVIGDDGTRDSIGRIKWLCRCDCGAYKNVIATHLTDGSTKSCGCYRKRKLSIHKMSNTREYRIWKSMKNRCLNIHSHAYNRYGAKGITICDEWLLFENFYRDMGNCPPNFSLDRIDNKKGYSKQNCRWADIYTQNNNRSSNIKIKIRDNSYTVSDFAMMINEPAEKIYKMIKDNKDLTELKKKFITTYYIDSFVD